MDCESLLQDMVNKLSELITIINALETELKKINTVLGG